MGGGLQRSSKMQTKSHNDRGISDDRVLGSGDFVVQMGSELVLREKMARGMPLTELAGRVEKYFGLEKNGIERRSKSKEMIAARDVYCYLAVRLLRYSRPNVGEILNIGRSAVAHAVGRGERVIESGGDLIGQILTSR